MRTNFWIGLIVVLALIAGGWFLWDKSRIDDNNELPSYDIEDTEAPTNNGSGAGLDVNVDVGADIISEVVVNYTSSGFEQKSITVNKGQTVKFINNSSSAMWVASAFHPTHDVYPEFDQLKGVSGGGTYSFTFDKVGTWNYHNHLKASDFGSVEVK